MFHFIKNLIHQRQIITKVGKSYSSSRTLDMGLPQGSILSPILFNILTHDLPNIINKDSSLVQYADDICLWKNVNIKNNTKRREHRFIQQSYQNDLDNLEKYMTQNGLRMSTEKTNLILFSAGEQPKNLPNFKLLTLRSYTKTTQNF